MSNSTRCPAQMLLGMLLCTLMLLLGSSVSVSAATYACADSACIQQRLSSALPGDVIRLAPGTYLGSKFNTEWDRAAWFYTMRSGTKEAPIILEAQDPTRKPVITGGSISDGYIFHAVGANWWIIRNIEFRTGAKGVILDHSNNFLLDGIEVHQVGDEGVHFRDGSSFNTIVRSKVYDTGCGSPGFGEGIYVGSAEGTNYPGTRQQINQACNYNRITSCTLGPQIRAESIDVKEKSKGTIVEDCTIYAEGISGANSADSSVNIKGVDAIVQRNRVIGTSNTIFKYAFKLYWVFSATTQNSGRNVTFKDNTADLGTRSDVYFLYVQSGITAFVSNNVRIPTGPMYTGPTKDVTPAQPPKAGMDTAYTPLGDATVRDGSQAGYNYAYDPLLAIKNVAGSMRLTLITFPISQLKGITIRSAMLRLYVKSSAVATLNVFPITSAWDESTVTWNTRPTMSTTPIVSKVLAASSNFVLVDIDITAHVKQLLSGTSAIASLALQDKAGKLVEMYSSEHTSGQGPKLVISA